MSEPKYLQQIGTDHVYVWTKELAKRPDMRPCDGPVVEPEITADAGQPQNQEGSGEPVPLDDMSKAELLELAKSMGLNIPTATAKADIIAKLREAQES